jgi:C-terminal processing protease CtpA/Prc
MKFLRQMILGSGMFALLAHPAGLKADVTNAPPNFKEVYDLIRTHLAGETQADLDRAAVQGLLKQLHSKVSLAAAPSETNSQSDAPLLAKSALYDGPIGYLRVGQVDEGLAGRITTAYKELNNTNQLKGLILDLRFTDGHDYAAASSVADLFLSKEAPLLDWGNGIVKSKAKSDAITIPVAVLVNRQTAAAAEALAAVLREEDRALLLGSRTAGEATMAQEFPLTTGQRLRIATAAIKLGNGETLSANGLTPDIQVAVNPDDERTYYADPFKEISKPLNLVASLGATATNANGGNGTNRPPRIRPTEADLIRERKERPGMELDYSVSAAREAEAEKPVIRDPVLGRALDLIKGISVLRPSKPS